MAKKKNKLSRKTQNSLKAAAASAILASSFLVPTSASVGAADNKRVASIRERVKTVRTLLREKLAADNDAVAKFSYSEMELAQWGNWGNWGKWNNWGNWNNWNNWANWGNWGNWRNW